MSLNEILTGNSQNRNEIEKEVDKEIEKLDNTISNARKEGNEVFADITRIQGAIILSQAKSDFESRYVKTKVDKWIARHLPQADPERINGAIDQDNNGATDSQSGADGSSQHDVGAEDGQDTPVVESSKPTKTLDSLIGEDLRKRLYTQVVMRIVSSFEVEADIPVYTEKNDNPGSFLFYGEPGTGKTHAVEGVAWALTQLGYTVGFYPATGSQIKSSGYSESEQRLEQLLRHADSDENDVSIVFIDEFEDIADRSGHEATASMANTLQTVTSGADVVESVVVIGATNYRKRVSDAIINRFTGVRFPEPSREAKIKLLSRYLGDAQGFSAEDLRNIKNMEGLTGRDMKKAAKAAADDSLLDGTTGVPASIDEMEALKNKLHQTPNVSISTLRKAIENRR